MDRIKGIKKLTQNRHLNLYELQAVGRDGAVFPYYVASRASHEDKIKAATRENPADGVVIYGVYGQARDRVVLIRQFRYPAGDYVYEFPAGLTEPGEDVLTCGIREMKEETGLTFTPADSGDFSRPFFTTVGLTDESCAMVFGVCEGTPSTAGQERTEDITVVLADRAECRRILREEKVSLMCAYMLMHFVSSKGDPLAFLTE